MSVRKSLICSVLICLAASHPLFAFQIDFSTATYKSNGAPEGWALKESSTANVSLSGGQPQRPEDSNEEGLAANFYNATLENLLTCSSPIEDDLVCNTVLANLRVYVQPEAAKIDAFQIVVSTNNWKSYVAVGNPIQIEEPGRKQAEWVNVTRSVLLSGLVDCQPDLYVGILMQPAGRSKKYGYIKSMDVTVAAAATPKNVCLKRNGIKTNKLFPGDDNLLMSVCVAPDPSDERLSLEGVYGVVDRNGVVSTNRLGLVEGTEEYTNSVLNVTLDAGEILRISAFTKYTSTLPTAGVVNPVDEYAYENLNTPVEYVVGKSGSVWINELSVDRVEICGTTNRVMTSGWSLVVVDGKDAEICRANLGDAFNFAPANMINGVVGIDVRNLSWIGGEPPDDGETYSVSLCNSRGIEEHTVQMVFSSDMTMGQTGYAKWHDLGYAYDWSGTATDGTFDWEPLKRSNFGEVNEGQGFNVFVSVPLFVDTVISYATVVASVSNINNSTILGTTTEFNAVSVDGVASLTIEGCTPFPGEIHAVLSGTAFGWLGESKGIVLTSPFDNPERDTLVFTPTVAFDDFTTLAGYWRNMGELKWEISAITRDGAAEKVLRLNTYSATYGTGILKCQNYLSANGRKTCSVAFDYRNTVDTFSTYDEFSVLVSTNADFRGAVKSTPALSNKRVGYGNGEWYRYQAVFELPESFRDAPELWIELLCISKFRTHTETCVDNFRIAFEDVALPTNLVRSVETPENGQNVEFVLDVLPQATGEVACVSADLHIEKNGVAEIVPLAFADGGLTNDLPAAAGAAQAKTTLGPFLVGDTVTYYAAVHYNSENGSTNQTEVFEKRYFPDNATIDDQGRWIVEGAYGVAKDLSANTFTVTGDPLTLVGEPETTADGVRFTVHGYSADLLSEVKILIDGKEWAEQPFDYLSTNNQIRVTGEFVVKGGLSASTTYRVTITGKDGNGALLAPATFDFVTKPLEPQISGTPKKESFTNKSSFDFYALTEAEDVTKLDFHWTLNGDEVKDNTTTNYQGSVSEGTNTVTVYATDWLGNVSPTNTLWWVYDQTAPTVPQFSDASFPKNGAFTPNPNYAFEAKSSDVLSPFTIYWKLGRGEAAASTGESFGGSLKDENDGEYQVSVWAVDKAGNVSATNTVSWTLDRHAPTDLKISEPPAEGVVTNRADFTFTASANDLTNLKYYWTTNGEDVVEHTAAELPGIAREGTNTVSVYAEDQAGNKCAPTNRTWVVDTIAPTKPEIAGKPTPITNVPAFSMTASSGDATRLTFWWSLNGAAGVRALPGEAFARDGLEDGGYTVRVYATDEAGNVSPTNNYSWMLDTLKPTNLKLDGEPQEGVVTNGTDFAFTASASDATALSFHWTTNGVPVADGTAAGLSGSAIEGTNTVSVYAKDAAGNACDPTNRTWVVDTIAPTKPEISGKPAALTNKTAFSMTASSVDATRLTYHWTFNDEDFTGATLAKTAREGANAARVYATDEAGNVSPTNFWNWVVDTQAPTDPVITGTPAKGSITNVKAYNLTAASTDEHLITYHWTLGVRKAAVTNFVGTAEDGDGTYTASVYATDAAGNVSGTTTWTWTLDTTAPRAPVISGTPANGSVTNEPNFASSA